MSFDFSRCAFMQLLGLAGVASSAPVIAPLFGSDESGDGPLTIADHRMVSGHFVVYPKTLVERVSREEQAEYARNARAPWQLQGVPVARVTRDREPKRFTQRRVGTLSVPPIVTEGSTVADGHAAFYVASLDVREAFSAFTRDTLSAVEPELRAMTSLVTIVDGPIHARPRVHRHEEGHPYYLPGDERQFDVVAEFTQFTVTGMPRREVESYRIYSESGEFPMLVPRDIDMGILLHMDRLVTTEGETDRSRVRSLLSRFGVRA